jgi:hypothetical protein
MTSDVISAWSRLQVVQLEGALLHSTVQNLHNSGHYLLLPQRRSRFQLPPIDLQIHLSPDIGTHYPSYNISLRT